MRLGLELAVFLILTVFSIKTEADSWMRNPFINVDKSDIEFNKKIAKVKEKRAALIKSGKADPNDPCKASFEDQECRSSIINEYYSDWSKQHSVIFKNKLISKRSSSKPESSHEDPCEKDLKSEACAQAVKTCQTGPVLQALRSIDPKATFEHPAGFNKVPHKAKSSDFLGPNADYFKVKLSKEYSSKYDVGPVTFDEVVTFSKKKKFVKVYKDGEKVVGYSFSDEKGQEKFHILDGNCRIKAFGQVTEEGVLGGGISSVSDACDPLYRHKMLEGIMAQRKLCQRNVASLKGLSEKERQQKTAALKSDLDLLQLNINSTVHLVNQYEEFCAQNDAFIHDNVIQDLDKKHEAFTSSKPK